MNMSHCKFRNTVLAVQQCMDNWEWDEDEGMAEDFSPEEERAKQELINLCREIVLWEGDE